ncbi:MAG: ROK family protein [Microthrixaceae bacterium]
MGGTKCLGVRLDGGAVVAERRVPTPSGVEAIADTLAKMARTLGPSTAVGVGVPGLVDRHGTMWDAPNLCDASRFDVHALLSERLPGRTVMVENDGACAAWAEGVRGAAAGVDDAVLVTVGTGIGGGIIAGGRLVTGAHGFAGELGSIVLDPHGPQCTCGSRGCWEALASGVALGRMGRAAAHNGEGVLLAALAGHPEAVRGEHVTKACLAGDEGALALLDTFAKWLAFGLANVVEIFDPEMVVLGGGVPANMGDLLLRRVSRSFDGMAVRRRHPRVHLVAARLGERAGAVGAALLASDPERLRGIR